MKIDPSLDLVLERTVDISPALVWKAWTTPEHLEKWEKSWIHGANMICSHKAVTSKCSVFRTERKLLRFIVSSGYSA